jgi:HlyD family secretion protein
MPTRSHARMPNRRGISSIWTILALVFVTATVVLFVPSLRKKVTGLLFGEQQRDYSKFIMETAKSGPFRILVTEHGELDSMQNVTLHNSVEGSTTIITIVAEGTRVNAPVKTEIAGTIKLNSPESESSSTITVVAEDGTSKDYEVSIGGIRSVLVTEGQKVRINDLLVGDVVCELDSSSLVDKERQQQITVTQALASLSRAEKNLEIQESTNESLLDKAKLDETLAELDFLKYTDEGGEYQQEKKTIDGDVKQIEEELAMAMEEYDYNRTQAKSGYKSQNDLEAARIKVMKQEILLGVKKGQMKVLEDFTFKRTVAELQQMAKDTKRSTLRAKLEGLAAMDLFKADHGAAELTLEVEQEKLDRLLRQIAACRLVAPQDGEVVYANQNSRRSEPVVIEEGVSVRERQAIIKLPDLAHMKVDARIHESKISRIREGLKVEINIDSLPGEPYHGVLDMVSSVPVPGSWPNTDLKEYEASIRLTDPEERVRKLKPGMSAEVKIIVEQRNEDVLQIPVQSVVTVGPKYFLFAIGANGPERREIVLGDTNDSMMEIIDGLAEGDKVILNPRTHFGDELNELEQQLAADAEADGEKPGMGRSDEFGERPGMGGGKGKSGGKGRSGGGKGKGQGAKARDKQRGPNQAGGNRPGGEAAARGGGQGRQGGFDPAAIFKRIDKNGDGKITSDESDLQGKFAERDLNGDGAVDQEEWKKAMSSMRR